jgi:hypothetical protein
VRLFTIALLSSCRFAPAAVLDARAPVASDTSLSDMTTDMASPDTAAPFCDASDLTLIAAEAGVTLADGDIVWDVDEDAQSFRRNCASDLYVHRFDPSESVTPERLHHLDGVDLPKLAAHGA